MRCQAGISDAGSLVFKTVVTTRGFNFEQDPPIELIRDIKSK